MKQILIFLSVLGMLILRFTRKQAQTSQEAMQRLHKIDAKTFNKIDKFLLHENNEGRLSATACGGPPCTGSKYGYYTIKLGEGFTFVGARDPLNRLKPMAEVYDFKNKTTINLGCNAGAFEYLLST